MKSLHILYSLLLTLSFITTSCRHKPLKDKRSQKAASVSPLEKRVANTLDLKDIPYTTDLNQISISGKQRADYVINYFAEQPAGLFPLNKADALDFSARAVASIRTGTYTKELDKIIKNGRAYGELGSSLSSSSCQRVGDFDIAALGLTWVLYEAAMKPETLSNDTMSHLMLDLIPSGKEHYEFIETEGCQRVKDTQTHIFITESSRYLNNQMLRRSIPNFKNNPDYDNDKNGFNEWMREKLRSFYIDYFDDFNARPSESLNLTALHLLYNFSEDSSVRTLAEGLLHITSALYGTQSSHGRRMAVFHKEQKYNDLSTFYQADAQIAHMSILAGNFKPYVANGKAFEIKYAKHLALMSATTRYRLPLTILSLILEPSYNEYLQIFTHNNYERYYNSATYKISGGGYYKKTTELGSEEVVTQAQPLVIFPHSSNETDYRKFIHFLGKKDPTRRDNHCITKNFACGIDLVIPDNIADSCKSSIDGLDGWEFYNFKSPSCPTKWGFYAAVFKGSYSKNDSTLGNFGIVELHEGSTEDEFENFKLKVKTQHENKTIRSNTRYTYKPAYEDNEEILEDIKVLIDTTWYPQRYVHSCHFESISMRPKNLAREKRATGIREVIESENGSEYKIHSPAFRFKMLINIENSNNPTIKEERETD